MTMERTMTRAGEIAPDSKRLAEIIAVFGRYGLAEPFRDHLPESLRRHLGHPDGSVSARPAPVRLRLALTELGPTFVKLGQMLSVTPGILPSAYADELAKLQEHVQPEPAAVARSTIERELGRPVDELFASFDDEPFAAASMAQVHRAKLHNRHAVAVKVQRDGIEEHVHVDLQLISYLAGVLEDHSDELRLYRPRELAARFRSRTLEELDFEREAANADRFAANFAEEPDVVFPRTYPELSSSRVLTMSLVKGTTFASETPRRLSHVDRQALGRRGAEIWLEMVFRDGFVHADPHPGNLVVVSGGRLGIIDTGMVLRIDDATREQFIELIDALTSGSSKDFAEALLEACEHPPGTDAASLADDLDGLITTYGNRSVQSMDVSKAIGDFAEVVHDHRLLLPAKISMLLQIAIELEGTSRLLDADFRIMPMLENYQHKLVAQEWSPAVIEKRLKSAARHWRHERRSLISTIEVLGEELRGGNLNLKLTHAGNDRVANRLIEGIITGSLLLASSILWQARAVPVEGGVPILAAVALTASVVLAVHLLFRIRASEEA